MRGKRGHVVYCSRAEQEIGKLGARARRAAEAGEIGVHAPEMPRRLVLLGIADGAQRAVGLDRHRAQRRARERERRRGEHAPVRIAAVARLGRRFERKPRAVEADQAVGELVLHRLELADELAELLSDLGVLDRSSNARWAAPSARPAQASRATSAMSASAFGGISSHSGRRVLERELGERRHREAGRRLIVKPGASLATIGDAGRRLGEDEKMRRRLRALDERQPSRTARRRARRPGRRPDRHRRRRAPAQPSPCPGADLPAGRAPRSMAGRKREVGGDRAEQRRRARGAAQLLEHQHDFAQSALGGIGTERRKPLPSHGRPQLRNRLGVAGILHGPVGRPNARRESPAPICGAGCARHPTRRPCLLSLNRSWGARERRWKRIHKFDHRQGLRHAPTVRACGLRDSERYAVSSAIAT